MKRPGTAAGDCPRPLILLAAAVLVVTGCQSLYYDTLERFGYQKREVLVDRVGDARDAQESAKEQFRSALDAFTAVVDVEGGELETRYETLNSEYEASKADAEAVRERVDEVANVAEALFDEWEGELDEYEDPRLRRASEDQLGQTRTRYKRLIGAMRRAEQRMTPVLAAFHDQELFLKHNLNARAIASLQTELGSVRSDVDALIEEMEDSIAEAEAFIARMGPASKGA